MSETENSSSSDVPPSSADALGRLLAEPRSIEREGLPRSYRMRADSHYVDHLESRHQAPPIRLISTRHLDAPAPPASVSLTKLVESIAARGIVQPLLVRRQNGRFQVIAGRKRLAAAIAAGVTDVPCLMYDVDEAEAGAIAEAENLRGDAPQGQGRAERDAGYADVLRTVSRDLAAIDASAAVLTRAASGALPLRVTADFIQAQAWRAAWLADAVVVISNQHGGSRAIGIESILDRVRTGFEAQARLTGLQLECAVGRMSTALPLDQELGTIAIAGCVFATLAWLEDVLDARVEVRADAPNARTLRVEVVQRIVAVDTEAARFLHEASVPRSRTLSTALGLMAAKSVATRYGGTVELEPIGSRGSVIRSTYCQSGDN